ncbi:hypothetical protein TELCIR_13052 [Teladorsagia circumcincta]|uniref:Uncharacterized protein n=1 Tax=Teladorsagia circumcincta TaxID=45464 RepID=A0A2G9U6Y9_TELCI|nr:hypothetical protein TELCIR_13052 [Teladorsagia circumcincta]
MICVPIYRLSGALINGQSTFQLKRTIVDPAEMTSSVYFLGNLVLGQMYCMAADRSCLPLPEARSLHGNSDNPVVIKGSADKSFLFSGLVELPCYFIMPVALDR